MDFVFILASGFDHNDDDLKYRTPLYLKLRFQIMPKCGVVDTNDITDVNLSPGNPGRVCFAGRRSPTVPDYDAAHYI